MSDGLSTVRGFRTVLTVTGSLYVVMATSMLVRGPEVLGEFGVAPDVIAEPVVRDFFSFFYLLMIFLGAMKVLLGYAARERQTQFMVASVLSVLSVITAFRDLRTSDSALGSSLYRGEATLLFVLISAGYALAYGYLAWRARPAGWVRA